MLSKVKTLSVVALLSLLAFQANAASIDVTRGGAPVVIAGALTGGFLGTPNDPTGVFAGDGDSYRYDEYTINILPAGVDALVSTIAVSSDASFLKQIAGFDLLKDGSVIGSALSIATPIPSVASATLTAFFSGASEYTLRIFGERGSEYAGKITASAVPLPAAVWLFLSALGGFGWLGRKKQPAATVAA